MVYQPHKTTVAEYSRETGCAVNTDEMTTSARNKGIRTDLKESIKICLHLQSEQDNKFHLSRAWYTLTNALQKTITGLNRFTPKLQNAQTEQRAERPPCF
jgi:hypothetical protein